ncbi:hypothetical protein TREMEDRAFT_73653 [Tremella mesenterica DSM 1558]|uniref:uncharacterized protein n=1 Tax=Tremella mesenterica (strain ATCC 24925 / CBS 8224 / DSM 1558 / NBRC 9311 / NRRL Y-6157 / RJB 2259-6 / UBC 559-6) TaxID=578456 RepID=UPI0003F48F20|nr:uncharacterized protein TREMEDRAFT_73653 [Tremella mesenterica DSM 1558]EIW69899.1 hypothetical protein TREMEDRAFT_73653 [Tremella mesenterica DSM 1558]
MSDAHLQPKQSIFSTLSLRARKAPSETLTHPLLAASSSQLNLTVPADTSEAGPSHHHLPPPSHSRESSFHKGVGQVGGLPYKPRQKHAGHPSTGSYDSVFGINTSPSTGPSIPTVSVPMSPSSVAAAPTTSTSTSTTFALPPSAAEDLTASTGSSGTATTRLQLQSLKAAAQRIGLGNGSMGIAMIDTIFEKGGTGRQKAGEGGDWGDVLRILNDGKAFLLLPTSSSSSLPITPQILRDHIIYLGPSVSLPSSEGGKESTTTCNVIVTLSGLVGTLHNSELSFQSIVPNDSPLLQALRDPSSRSAAISALRPTLFPLPPPTYFPSFTLSTDTASLVFPPPSKSASLITATEKEKDKTTPGKIGRINPFASFFGSSSSSPTPTSSPSLGQATSPTKRDAPTLERPLSPSGYAPEGTASPLLNSPRPSVLSIDHHDGASLLADVTQDGFTVSAYTVSRSIRHSEVHKTLSKALRAYVREHLARLPDKVVERVVRLVLPAICPTLGNATEKESVKPHPDEGMLQLDFCDPAACGDRLQDFMEGVYDDLVDHFRSDSSSTIAEGLLRKSSGGIRGRSDLEEADDAAAREKRRKDREEMAERQASDGTERVEAIVCQLLYNRLYSPLESDDPKHDEALASRIAALNILDLSLDHLGLITRPDEELGTATGNDSIITTGLNDIAQEVGEQFQHLTSVDCLSPKDKADVLIRAHKLVVDGLAKLPTIKLRPEGEPYRPTPQPSSRDRLPDVELPEILEQGVYNDASMHDDPTWDRSTDSHVQADETGEETPHAFPSSSNTAPPVLDLSPPTEPMDSSQLQEAMSSSVLTLPIAPLSLTTPVIEPTDLPEPSTTPMILMTDSFPDKLNNEKLETSTPGTSGADLILPIIIYSVVRSNPPQLASQLMYLRRYRSAICLTGEASYAVVNLTAVVEFLEHVNLVDLGLGEDSAKVMSIADLSPIGLALVDESNEDAISIASASSRLRGKVFQVGELAGSAAGSANKVITGVVDSSWTALRGLIVSNQSQEGSETTLIPDRPRIRQRQASTFSLASVTASVASIAAAAASTAAARSRSRANSKATQVLPMGREMIDVSFPSRRIENESQDGSSESEMEEQSVPILLGRSRAGSEARSIKSVSSTMREQKEKDRERQRERERIEKDRISKEEKEKDKDKERQIRDDKEGQKEERASLSDRLASIGVLGKYSSPTPSINNTNLEIPPIPPPQPIKNLTTSLSVHTPDPKSPTGSTSSLPSFPPSLIDIEPPIERFVTCDLADLRLSDVGALLRDYRRLAGIVTALQMASRSPQQ